MGGDIGLTPSGLITSLELSRDGTMYVGANGEIWTYETYLNAPPAADPKVYLTGLKVMNTTWATGHQLDAQSSFELNSEEKVFSISFGAVDFRFQSDNHYQYRLEGFSNDWVDLGKTDTVTFANLPPNDYIFNVRVINELGQISRHQAEVEIHIERPFWTKPLAIVSYAVVFLGLIGLFLKLWEGRLMKNQIQELEIARLKVLEANKRLSFLTMNDTLTGLLNRRGFDQGITHALNTAKRNGLMITLLMMDVDFFKLFNDNYGHVQGDEVLRKVGVVLRSVFERSTDIIARYGGEEFAVVFIGENPSASVTLANDLILAVRDMGIPHDYSSVSDKLTLSAGSATIRAGESLDVEKLISLADRALYSAKEGGRDRVCFTGIIPELPEVMKNERKPLVLDMVPEG
jgi:diguanylate cyclase (GGDEF)-like protein